MMGGFLPEGWRPHRSPRDPSIVLDDGTAQPPQRPEDAHPAAGQWEPPQDAQEPASGGPVPASEAVREFVPYMDQMRAARERTAAEVLRERSDPDPGEATRTGDFPESPDYSRRASRALGRIDDAIEDNLREANQRLRRDLRAEIDYRRTVEHERDAALARVAELTLTLQALGRVVVHAAGHDEKET